MKIAVLGAGAVAQALWRELPGQIVKWRRPGKLPALDQVAVVLLAVSDGALEEVVARLEVRPGQVVAHLAGALGLGPLKAALARGARTGSIHPLRAFVRGKPASFRGAAAGITGSDARARAILSALARKLGMKPLPVPGAARALYHAAAVLAAGAEVALFSEAVRAFQAASGVTESAARAALLPLTLQALGKLAFAPAPSVITGPAVRGDAATVVAHRAALPADLLPLYDALTKISVFLAREGHRARPRQLADVLRALERPWR